MTSANTAWAVESLNRIKPRPLGIDASLTREQIVGAFVVARGDAAVVFDLVDEARGEVAMSIR